MKRKVPLEIKWKYLRVREETHFLYKVRAAKEGKKIHDLANYLIKVS